MRKISFLLFIYVGVFSFSSLELNAQNGPGGVGNIDGTTTSLKGWFKSNSGVVYNSSNKVTAWNNNVNIPQFNLTAVTSPNYVENILNGYPVINFASGNILRTSQVLSNTYFPTNAATFIMVLNKPNASTVFPFITYPFNAANRFSFAVLATSNQAIIYLGDNGGGITGNNSASDVYSIINYTASPAGKDLRRNQTFLGNAGASASSFSAHATSYFEIGDGSYPFIGNVAEFIMYNGRLNLAQRTIIDNYLSAKYNLVLAAGTDKYAANDAAYVYDIAGIGELTDGDQTLSGSAGFYIAESGGSLGNGEFVMVGHSNLPLGTTNTDIVPTVVERWNRVWYLEKSGGSVNATISFDYSEGIADMLPGTAANYQLLYRAGTSGNFAALSSISATIINSDQVSFDVPNANLNNGYYTLGTTNAVASPLDPSTFYSFQSGNWTSPTTWTTDPSGSTQIGSSIPGVGDVVHILSGRTVTLNANVTSASLDITINSGGFLDMGANWFTSTLTALKGTGTLKLSTANFPVATTNTFVNAGGGTTEYTGSLTLTQLIYNNLVISNGGTVVQTGNVQIFGNLDVKNGTYQINDATAARRQLIINGNVTVDAGAFIKVGTGVTNTTTNPGTITGGALPYTSYYETQSHRIELFGDFTNNGTVQFTNLTNPIYNAFPPTVLGATTGFATVYFRGTTDNTLTCNGQTDFYNLIVDKGIDQTYSLSIYSSGYSNFRLLGANNAAAENPATADPNLRKALWVRYGTLKLSGSLAIPSLTEGNAASTGYIIPSKACLELNGPSVIVLVTADDYREVNVANNFTSLNDGALGITKDQNSSLSILGKLTINNGYLSTRESAGIKYYSYASGQLIINNGTIDSKQISDGSGGNAGIITYIQNGGWVNLRGRFQHNLLFGSVNDLINTQNNTTRLISGIDGTSGSFSINSNSATGFALNSGTIRIYDVCGNTAAVYNAYQINCPISNINVTGGTLELLPQTGSAPDATSFAVTTRAAIGNVLVNRGAGCATAIQNQTYELTVLKNLTLQSGVLNSGNMNFNIGGNFSLSAGTIYNQGINTTVFNGSGDQTFSIAAGATSTFNNITISKATGENITVTGTQATISISNNLNLYKATLNTNGKTLNVARDIYNSGVQSGNGKIVLNGTLVQAINGDGNGIFNNLELYNTNAAAAPVTLNADITVNTNLNLYNAKIFNIGGYNLKIGSDATITATGIAGGFGDTRCIQTTGAIGDKSITKTYSATSKSFTFPIGATSTRHAAVNYSPATITINGNPTVYGTISVSPVGFEHPNTTTQNRSLTYFWRTRSSGFTLGAATVTHQYVYSQNDVIPAAGDISEAGFVAARYDYSALSWSRGTANDVDDAANIIGEPGTGNFLEGAAFINGDYTAGDDNATNPFPLNPTKFYSRINGAAFGSGLWSDPNTWSYDSHTGPANTLGAVPGANDIVIIGGLDSVYLDRDRSNPWTTDNVDPRSCASLQIEVGSCFDMGYNTNSVFRVVMSHPGGNGNFRLTTSSADGSSFTFPTGDFSDFNANRGTTEFYTTDPATGPIYILPTNATSYGTVILSPLGGSNMAFPNIPNVTILGDLITRGQNTDSWFAMTWFQFYGAIVAKTISISGNMYIQGGTFAFLATGATAQQLNVNGNLVIYPNAGLDIAPWGGVNSSNCSITLGGSLINNTNNNLAPAGGFIGGNVRLYNNATNSCTLTFNGSTPASLTNTGTTPATGSTPNTILGNVFVNKGNSQATTLTCNIGGTLTTLTNNWLTLQNGTFRYERTGNLNISTTNTFTIPATAGLYINTPSSVNIAQGNVSNNTVYLNGKLTLAPTSTGTVYIGATANTNVHNDIEYSTAGFSEIEVNGGTLSVNGQIRRNTSSTSGILKYTQTGGTVTILGTAAANAPTNINNAKLEILNTGSQFNMSGGTLNIVRGGGNATYGDLYLRPQNSTVTGGSIIFTPGTNGAQTYKLDANVPLYHLFITGGGGGNNASVSLMTSPLVVQGNFELSNNNSFFDVTAANLNVTIGGNFNNANALNSVLPPPYQCRQNTTTFNGNVQTLSLARPSNTTFYNVVVNSITSLTINSDPINISNDLTISNGTLDCGANNIYVAGDLFNNGRFIDNGTGITLNNVYAIQHHIGGTGSFGKLTLNDATGAVLDNDITMAKDIVLTTGSLNLKSYLLTLGVSSNIGGAPFGPTKMFITDGIKGTGGISKYFNTVVAGNVQFRYPLGTASKFTPADITINNNSDMGSIRINNVNSSHPTLIDPANALNYYWEIESSGVSGFDGQALFTYSQTDVLGLYETSYVAARLVIPGYNWVRSTTVDPALNTFSSSFSGSDNLGGEYTAGITTAFPGSIPIYKSISNGNWNDKTIWQQIGGDAYTLTSGPNGFIVIVDNVVTVNANYCNAFRTTINNKLKVVSPYFGHNFGNVEGNGTLYLESGSFPAGVYTTFLDCSSNGAVEYGGTGSTYTIIADLFDRLPRVIFSGTGTRILPNKDLTICKSLRINGPTLDNSLYNKQLTILDTMMLVSGAFKSGTGATATVSFAGTALQSIGGTYGDFKGTNCFNNLEINNAANLSILNNGDIEVAGTLLLTNGLINTSTTTNSKLTITNTLSECVVPGGGSTTSYVNGPLKKKINQGDYFLFPVGQGITAGNKLMLSASQTGTIFWTVEYKNPNPTSASKTAALVAVSAQEYWKVDAPAGSEAVINIAWTPSSDITPLSTQSGTADMRVAGYNAAPTNLWDEIASTATGDNFNGTVSTVSRYVIPAGATKNYTLASTTSLKPRARLAPTGPVCGTNGIPVSFTNPDPIPLNYKIVYTTTNPVSTQTAVITSTAAYSIPTNPASSQVYQLVSFTYNTDAFGNGGTAGVIDNTSVTAYANPTLADAGPDQALCSTSATILAGNNPGTGTALWSILSGTGGTVISPTVNNSSFIGTLNRSYVLQWKISNGTCISTDNVNIAYTVKPYAPTATNPQTYCSGAQVSNLTANPPLGGVINWYSASTGGVLYASNTVLVNNTTYYAEAYNGCQSSNRTPVLVSIVAQPTAPTLNVKTPNTTGVCDGNDVSATFTAGTGGAGGTDVFDFSLNGGSSWSAYVPGTLINTVGLTNVDIRGHRQTAALSACVNTPPLVLASWTVHTAPVLTSTLTPPATCSNSVFNYTPTSSTFGATFNWNRTAVAGVSNLTASGTGNPTETLINTTASPVAVTYVYSVDINGCTSASTYNVITNVNPTPTITLGANPDIGEGTTTTSLPYTATTNNPDRYSIDFDATAETAGFVDVGISALPVSPVSITVPGAAAPATYNATFNIRINATGCNSNSTFSIKVNYLPVTPGIITGVTPVCQGDGSIVYTVPVINYATNYVWSLPAGATITAGDNTRSITVSFSNSSATGNVVVYGNNTYGNGPNSPAFAVTVNKKPVSGPLYRLSNQ